MGGGVDRKGTCVLIGVHSIMHLVDPTKVHATNTCKAGMHETKTSTMLGEVGMANESTKTTQTSVWMAQHNEQTWLA